MATISDLRKIYLGAPGLTDEDWEIVKGIRDFVDKEIMPRRRDLEGGWHHDEKLARDTIKQVHQGLVALGFQRMSYPEAVGGLGKLGVAGIGQMEIARADCGLATHLAIVGWVISAMISAGRFDLAEPIMRKACDDKPHAACFALTEPGGGANQEDPTQHGRTISTIARLDGNEWIINGHKIWPSGAGVSDLSYLTLCTTDPEAGDDGIALIHVPPDAKGLSFSKPYEKMGMCWSDVNAEIFYDDVRVPRENRLSGPGEDAKILHDTVGRGRLGTCAMAAAAARACFEIVVDYTRDREIVGKPVRSRSLHASIIGEMALKIDCAIAFYQRVAEMSMSGQFGRIGEPFLLSKASAASYYGSEAAVWVARKAMELMGSYGYAYGYEIEKYYRDVVMLELWLGGQQRRILDTALGYYSFEW